MVDRTRRIAVLTLVGVIAVGCQFMPTAAPTVTCVDVEPVICDREADRLIEEAKRMQPPKGVVSIRITDVDGGHVEYDDGTWMSWVP